MYIEGKAPIRITEIDVAKGLGILLTIIGHTTLWETPSHNFVYSFHMPLFFFLSGLVMNSNLKSSKKECKKLLASYLIWSLLFSLFDIYTHSSSLHLVKSALLTNTLFTISFWGISVLWFLPALILTKFFTFIIKRICPSAKIQLLILTFLVLFALWAKQSWMEWNVSPDTYQQFFYYAIGCIIRSITQTPFVFIGLYSQTILKKIVQLPRHFCLLLGSMILLAVYILSQFIGRIDIHELVFPFYPIFLFVALLGCYGTILFSHALCQSKFISPVFTTLGKNSLFIMATHNYFFIPDSVIFLLSALNIKSSIVSSALYYMLLLLIELVLIKIIAPLINYLISFITRKSIYQ